MNKAINRKILLILLSIKLKIKYIANDPKDRISNKLLCNTFIVFDNLEQNTFVDNCYYKHNH